MFTDPPLVINLITYLRSTVYLEFCQFDSVKVITHFRMLQFYVPPPTDRYDTLCERRVPGMGDTIGIGDRYFDLRYQVSVSVSVVFKERY